MTSSNARPFIFLKILIIESGSFMLILLFFLGSISSSRVRTFSQDLSNLPPPSCGIHRLGHSQICQSGRSSKALSTSIPPICHHFQSVFLSGPLIILFNKIVISTAPRPPPPQASRNIFLSLEDILHCSLLRILKPVKRQMENGCCLLLECNGQLL